MSEKVYISSTYEDLKGFRQAAVNCVVSLVEYYTPLSMEFYDSEDQHFVSKCLNDVANSDIYILLLGKRYGYLPHGFQESITELEYKKAVSLQQGGHPIQILVFKASEYCVEYNYQENNARFIEYQQEFLSEINERLSPKPFDSEADLKHQVYHSLMRRLLKKIKINPSVVTPDKDNLICFCDRNIQLKQLKEGVWRDQKRLFFLQGSRKVDLPNAVLNRFSKFVLNFEVKIEPAIKITDLFTSTVKAKNVVSALSSILEYLHINFDFTSPVDVSGFIDRLAEMKYKRVILPFYFDLDIDRLEADSNQKLKDFLDLLYQVLTVHKEKKPKYELYIMILLFQKDSSISYANELEKNLTESKVEDISLNIKALGKVNENDIADWIEQYFISSVYSSAVLSQYFPGGSAQYSMQEAALKLKTMMDDLTAGKEELLKYLKD